MKMQERELGVRLAGHQLPADEAGKKQRQTTQPDFSNFLSYPHVPSSNHTCLKDTAEKFLFCGSLKIDVRM